MSVANLEAFALSQGINKAYKEMTQAEQATLRYNYLMSAGADANGDFARTSDSLANQMKIAQLNMQSLSADIGKLLLPVAQEAVGAFNEVGEKLREAFNDPAIQDSIVTIAEGVGELVKAVADFVIEWLPKIIDGLAWIADNGEQISGLILAIGTAWATWKVLSTLAAVLPVVVGFMSTLFLELATAPTIMAGVSSAMAMLGGPVTLIIGLIAALVGAVIYLWNTNEDFRNFWIGCWESVKTFFTDCWNGLISFFTETIPSWIDSIIEWFEGIPQWFSELPGKIGYALGYALASMVQWGIDCYNWVLTEVPKIIDGIVTFFSELPGEIWGWLCETVSNIVQWGADMYDSACQAAEETIDGIIEWFCNLPEQMMDIGANIIRGLWDGITGMGSWLMDKISGFCSGLLDGFLGFFDIHSPSRLFRDLIGINLVKGIGVGIDVETPNLEKDINANMAELTAKLKGTVDYETAKTTASVVAKQNFIVGGGTDDKTQERHAEPKIVVDNHVYIDGKECMQTLAPHQEVWEQWNEGR